MSKKVMVFGTFDYLHPGHHNFFTQARAFGDYLIVVIARDVNAAKFKGAPPDHTEEERKRAIEEAQVANKVMLGSTTNPFEAIIQENPEVICLGYDQIGYSEKLSEKFPEISVVRLKPFHPEKYKSSLIKQG